MTIPNREKARSLRQQQTSAEQRLWQQLRNRQLDGYKFHRQYVIAPYIVDFACRAEKLIVELDGTHHAEPDQAEYDQIRSECLAAQGYRILRFWNTDIDHALPTILETIKFTLKAPLPPGEGLG
ncbi:endonuclease domain-containing protein [Thiothrix winogradskyi]|uniref:DUF559 domain-containing protein n=1 Tax=Thiothrix winogradskyi TaxID=96472 RepID=A0ABY3T3E5_9GAMM|nr:DUF559 domain-containing protein [Thiothrix winogradskyi]UJS25286.1 DUF559 domain-containing protein [Thiothrix winogradskyi]